MKKVLIVGAGIFGTAIGLRLKKNLEIHFYEIDQKKIKHWKEKNFFNFWQDIKIPSNFSISSEVPKENFDFIFIAVPSKYLIESFNAFENSSSCFVLLSKGFDPDEEDFPIKIISKKTKKNIVVFSGPDFASEIARGCNFGATITSKNLKTAKEVAKLFDEKFEYELSEDPFGVEFLGIAKNVAAIYMGYLKGSGINQSEKLLNLTKMFKEIRILGKCLGIKEDTFFSLAGFGDFVLTTLSDESRNKSFGMKIAKGEKIDKKETVEGAHSAKILFRIAKSKGLKLPLLERCVKIIESKKI